MLINRTENNVNHIEFVDYISSPMVGYRIYNKDNKNGYANEIVAWKFSPEPYKEV